MSLGTNAGSSRLGFLAKVRMFTRIWRWFLIARFGVGRETLPVLVERLGDVQRGAPQQLTPKHLGLIVHRSLAIGSHRPKCLNSSLVLYRLLREQGEVPEIVIGLPSRPFDKDAHAWIEVDGVDVGPPPGRSGHVEIARYGGRSPG